MAEPKAPPQPAAISADTVFIKNPTGAVHDVSETDARTIPVVEQAKKNQNGWSLASDEEIVAYCEANNLAAPAKKASKAAKE